MAVDLSQLEQQFGLPPGLLTAQINAESGGNPNAVSPAGAVGLAQFMPATAAQYGIDPTDPDQAKLGMAMYDADNLKKYNGDVPSALAAYNWGPGNVDKQGVQNAPEETQSYISKIMSALNPVGTAKAAEVSYDNQSRSQQVAQDVSQGDQSSNAYDNLSDEQLLAEAKKQGIDLNDPVGAQPWSNLPKDQQIQSAPLSQQGNSSSPYDNLSNEQLIAEARKQGIPTQLPTGTAAYVGELKTAATNAGEMAASGAEDVGRALSPISALAKMAFGYEPSESEKDYLNQSTAAGALSPLADVSKGLGKGALGALGMIFSPLSAANRSFAGNPIQNSTGIPSGVTDFALSLLEPAGIEKALGAAAEGGKALASNGALSKLQSLFGAADTSSEPALTQVTNSAPQSVSDAVQAAAPEITGSTTPEVSASSQNIPMSAGQATQNPSLQRFEADALAGAKGPQAESQALDFVSKQQQAVGQMLKNLGDYKVGGNPSDSVGAVVNMVKANEGAASNAVDKAWQNARDLGQDVILGGKSNKFTSSGYSPYGITQDMKIGLQGPLSTIADEYAFNSGDMNSANALYKKLTGLINNPDGSSLSDFVGWRRTATNLSKQGGSQGNAIGKMVGTYDNYMGNLAERLSGAGDQQTSQALTSFKNAVGASRDYYSTYGSNSFVQDIVGGNKTVDDLTLDLLGRGQVGNKSGMLDNLNGILRASGTQAPLVKSQLQTAYAQKIYDTVAGSKLAGTDIDSISLPKLQTALDNIFTKNREFATALYGPDATSSAQQAIQALDLINSRQANVGNAPSSGYTVARLALKPIGGIISHIPGMSHIADALSGLSNLGQEAKAGKEAAQTFSGVVPKSYKPVPPSNPLAGKSAGSAAALAQAINKSRGK